MAAADDWHGWFPTSVCCAFLGVGRSYFDKAIKPRVPADCVYKYGKANWYLGRAVYEAAAGRKQSVAVREVDRELSEGDPMLAGGDSPALERFRAARADMVELQLEERKSVLIPRDEVHDGLGRLATIIRGACETLQKQFGKEAHAIIDDALEDFEREAENAFSSESEIQK